MDIRIFIYGTLKKGHINSRYLKDAEFICEDIIKGTMYWAYGSMYDFPIVTLEGDTKIHGEVYKINKQLLSVLDGLEGYPTLYKRKELTTEKGHNVIVYYQESEQIKVRKFKVVKDGIWK